MLVTAPAVVAGLAYLNAKTQFSQDAFVLFTAMAGGRWTGKLEKEDRMNMFYRIEEHALNKKTADQTFLIYNNSRYTYKQSYEIIIRYGTWLKQTYNIKPKEIVAMYFGNSDIYVFIWFGLWSIGAKPAFINYNLTNKPLSHSIRTATTRLVLVDPEFESNITSELKSDLPGVEWVTVTPKVEAEAMNMVGVRAPDADRSESNPQNMALLIYTSGTTGLPKPANFGWLKATSSGHFFSKAMGYKSSDVFYTSMPLYHSSGSILGVCTTVIAGATICIGRKFSTKTFWRDVRDSNATIIQYVGETCRYLLSAPPEVDPSTGGNLDKKHNVRLAFGNGLRPDIWNRFKERFGITEIAEFYGATEGSGASFNFSRNDLSKGAIGRQGTLLWLMSGTRAIVEVDWITEQPWRDPKTGFCKQVPNGQPGELLYKLDPADVHRGFQGYHGNEKASQSKLMRDVLVKGDIYFRTGDTVKMDSEGKIMYFSDRIGDTFRWKGENVSTNEVSEALGTNRHVKEANVYGVELPNHDGRAGCVAIILADEPKDVVMTDLAKHAKANLPRYAVPLFLRVTKGMELTGTNKQQKHIIRAHGVDPAKMGEDRLYWLKGDTYVPFSDQDWSALNNGKVKL